MNHAPDAFSARPRLGFVDDASFDLHHSPVYHPERPERLLAARAALARVSHAGHKIAARSATVEELSRVHDEAYVLALRKLAGKEAKLDVDTYVVAGSIDAAERAAGGAVALVDAILNGEIVRGVALLRPPGHHARPGQAMGFCILNNVAVAAAHARASGLERIAIIDWDVHHGNGTQEMFFGDPHVLYASLHQAPFYPGTGAVEELGHGDGRGYSVNVPLSLGAHFGDYAAAFERVIVPVLEAYAPELVLISAGFDAHVDDPLGSMQLDAPAYGWMTALLSKIARRSARDRIALFLEGGYHLGALEASLGACWEVLGGEAASYERSAAPDRTHDAEIERARRVLSSYWKL